MVYVVATVHILVIYPKTIIATNLTFVTELLTFIAGAFSWLLLNILYRLFTPVVVSSVMPRMPVGYGTC